MPRQERGVFRKRVDAGADGLQELLPIAVGEVGPADGSLEDRIAAEGDLVVGAVEEQAARAVARDVVDRELLPRRGEGVALAEPGRHLGRMEILVRQPGDHRLVAVLVGFDVLDELAVGAVREHLRPGGGEGMRLRHVVPMAVREEQVGQAQAALTDEGQQEGGRARRGVHHGALLAVVRRDEVDVRLEGSAGRGFDLHGHDQAGPRALRMASSRTSGGRMALKSGPTKACTVKPSTRSSPSRSTW